MSDLYWLTDEQMARLEPFSPGAMAPRADDRRVLSGIIFVNRNGLRWRDAPRAYGPAKTLCNRWKRWGEKGVFIAMMDGLSAKGGRTQDGYDRRDLSQSAPDGIELAGKKGDAGRLIDRTKGGMNIKLHAVTDARGRPISLFMTAGQVSDYTVPAALLDALPKAQWLLGERSYDADWFRDALQEKGITPCIPGRKSRNKTVKYDKRRYKSRSRIEIMFGRLKDWRRVATRYDRCPNVFLSTVALAVTVMFWL